MTKEQTENIEKEIRSIGELESVVKTWEQRFSSEGRAFPPIWYRGQGNFEWELTPEIERHKFLKTVDEGGNPQPGILRSRELTINKEFKRRAAPMLSRGTDYIDIYLLARHHGLPTRLLDWTRNPLAALFFAVTDQCDKDGSLIVLEPKCVLGNDKIMDPISDMNHDLISSLMKYSFEQDPAYSKIDNYVLSIFPDLQSGRMLNQDSVFTLHMPGAVLIDSSNDYVEKYLIPQGVKMDLQIILRRLGISWASLFPDLDHLVKELRLAWKID